MSPSGALLEVPVREASEGPNTGDSCDIYNSGQSTTESSEKA